MAKDRNPVTPAVRLLKQRSIPFAGRPYNYEEHGGTAVCARELQVAEHAVIKTLVMEDDNRQPLLVLMHGDRQVSTKSLARTIGVKQISPCTPDTAHRHTGYLVGGTSPFGTRKSLPVYMEASILELPVIYINGGKRGFLLEMAPGDLQKVLDPVLVEVAVCPED
jgi:Cys-tRNA(Pro) deacylase